MQTDQQLSTTQPKKTPSGAKKEKKPVKVSKTDIVQEQMNSPVIEQTSTPTASIPVMTETQENIVTETIVTQESDINSMIEYINNVSDKLTEMTKYFKDNIILKDERNKLEVSFKKFNKSTSFFQNGYTEYLSKQVSLLEKNSGNKSTSVKKVTDKGKAAIHKKLNVHPFLLSFMKLEPNTLVSRSDALTAITGYVKVEKLNNPDIILSNDKKTFKLIGDLKPLFDGIENVMKSKNLLTDTQMPTAIKYTQIMQYMTHCFIKDE